MVVITASAPKVPVKTMAAEFLAAKSAAMKKVLSPSSEKNINKNAEAKPVLISPRSPRCKVDCNPLAKSVPATAC
uniref:GDT1-like protein 1ic isoform X1 n=1 Tax=Rhizophora mucronata TaxID=61149 RepID=A0A2P2LLX6_RHIMU